MSYRAKDATPVTASVNREGEAWYPLEDRHDFVDARRELIAPIPNGRVLSESGEVIFDLADFAYLADDAPRPDTVDASLWRTSQVIHEGGLYKVVDHLYQVRNNDLANLTIVEGDDGLIIIDCTTGVEAAAQGLALFRQHVADKPVAAVIYTHTHVDHYGGVKGVVDAADVASGRVPIIAPGTIASFDKFAIGENVVAGNAMSRRAMYAFGILLDREPKQFVTLGAGIGNGRRGITISYLSPTDPITQTGQTRTIAGLTFEFLYAPDTEAPEEMHIWIPELKALTCAENANHCLHNIQTLRGARTRDARNFARYLDETLERWGDQAEVHFGPHSWPIWGNENIVQFLEDQRDMYKYIHDQALRLANKGYTPLEAAEVIELPPALARKWYNRQYHGTVAPRRARSVHQRARHVGRRPGLPAPPRAGRDRQTLRRPHRRRQDPPGRTSAPSTTATTAGPPRSCTTWSSPNPTTPRRRTCKPTPTSRWATRPKPHNGVASS